MPNLTGWMRSFDEPPVLIQQAPPAVGARVIRVRPGRNKPSGGRGSEDEVGCVEVGDVEAFKQYRSTARCCHVYGHPVGVGRHDEIIKV